MGLSIDREKVIKGLETCRTRVHCKECPYAYDKRADDSYCEAVLHNDVLALLKEQEVQKFFVDESGKITPLPVVVRCKDCKHRPIKPNDYENGFDLEFPDNKCPCQNGDDGWYSWYPADNWYCAEGERKEDDG